MAKFIKQWVEVGGVPYAEYGEDEPINPLEDYLFPEQTEQECLVKNAWAKANNNLQSAKYQLQQLVEKNELLPLEHRLRMIDKFLSNAIAAIQEVKELQQ